jgi:hypothetical protein
MRLGQRKERPRLALTEANNTVFGPTSCVTEMPPPLLRLWAHVSGYEITRPGGHREVATSISWCPFPGDDLGAYARRGTIT